MRSPSSLVRLASAFASVLVVLSCDTDLVKPRFGAGLAGGPTGAKPFVSIDTPAAPGQIVNVGDSVLVVTRLIDERQLATLVITGIKYIGSAALGTLAESVRYSPVNAGPFPIGVIDTTVRRYLKPTMPVDSSVDSMVIRAVVRDAVGNLDTAEQVVNIILGAPVIVTAPGSGASVRRSIPMPVSARGRTTIP